MRIPCLSQLVPMLELTGILLPVGIKIIDAEANEINEISENKESKESFMTEQGLFESKCLL